MPLSANNQAVRVLDPGLGASIQDSGRPGWRRFGVPPGGWMDPHAAACANGLLDNSGKCQVIEGLLHGLKVEALKRVWVALAGAAVEASHPQWRAVELQPGEMFHVRRNRSGLWYYLAIEGGFDLPEIFGSASYYQRGQIGHSLKAGDVLTHRTGSAFRLPKGVSGRIASWTDIRDYSNPPVIRVWEGPQWDSFTRESREALLREEFTITTQCDRVGYRLEGGPLVASPVEIISEPVRTGAIQAPENGQPIIMMRDGPTIGGYPKIAVVEEEDLGWVAQARPGQKIRFQLLK